MKKAEHLGAFSPFFGFNFVGFLMDMGCDILPYVYEAFMILVLIVEWFTLSRLLRCSTPNENLAS